MNAELKDKFLTLDAAGIESPHSFDGHRLRKKIGEFESHLNSQLPKPVQHIFECQDATFFAQFQLPTEASIDGSRLYVYISSFGGLMTVEGQENLAPQYIDVLKSVAEQNDFQLVDEKDLLESYEGIHPGFLTWWDRFFDYL